MTNIETLGLNQAQGSTSNIPGVSSISIRHPAKLSFASDVDTKKVGTVQSTSSVSTDKGGLCSESNDQSSTQMHDASQLVDKIGLHHQVNNWQFDRTAALNSGDLTVDDIGHKAKTAEADHVELATASLEKGERSQEQNRDQQDQKQNPNESQANDFHYDHAQEKQLVDELSAAFKDINEKDIKAMKRLLNNPLNQFNSKARKISYFIFPPGLIWDGIQAFRSAPSFAKIERAVNAYQNYRGLLAQNIDRDFNADLVEQAFAKRNQKNPNESLKDLLMDEIAGEAEAKPLYHTRSDFEGILDSAEIIFGSHTSSIIRSARTAQEHEPKDPAQAKTRREERCAARLLDSANSQARVKLVTRAIDKRIANCVQKATGKESTTVVNLIAGLCKSWKRVNPILKSGWINADKARTATNHAKEFVNDAQKQASNSVMNAVQTTVNGFSQDLKSTAPAMANRFSSIVNDVLTSLGGAEKTATKPGASSPQTA
ncbi:MAG: hypothetical protein HOA17_08300 [Candidatus Melainabacteria bacterium]|jgi:hypothetical protein|nr:hypothetical protein [Candidatus Melainabacteria bacterium]